MTVDVQYIGGPSAIVGYGGLSFVIDPTFDPPGEHPIGARSLAKTAGPALEPQDIGPVDAVLLSHDQHPDNLDNAGRAYLATVPLVLSTASARERLGGHVRALRNWQSAPLVSGSGHTVLVTGVPALHGPEGSEPAVGEVTGFVLSGQGLPTVYISGDNASLRVVREIADRVGPVDIALLFAGAARTALIPGENLTLDSAQAAEAAQILGEPWVVPLHFEHWAHFTEGRETVAKAFEQARLANRLRLLPPGGSVAL
jgi:L-ascorbate metabolism protein UlaG (beta-lactamase superfamily)